MSVESYRGSPGKFDSRTLNMKTLNRWTGRSRRPETDPDPLEEKLPEREWPVPGSLSSDRWRVSSYSASSRHRCGCFIRAVTNARRAFAGFACTFGRLEVCHGRCARHTYDDTGSRSSWHTPGRDIWGLPFVRGQSTPQEWEAQKSLLLCWCRLSLCACHLLCACLFNEKPQHMLASSRALGVGSCPTLRCYVCVCICMCVCIYIYIYICIMCIYIYIYMFMMYIYIYIYIYIIHNIMYKHVHICAHVCIYIYIHMQRERERCIHTCYVCVTYT